MSVSHILLKTLCMAAFITSMASGTREELAEELIEHVLRIPNPDKVLNTVLGRLERSRELVQDSPQYSAETDCEDPTETLPEYTESLESTRQRELRQLGPRVSQRYN